MPTTLHVFLTDDDEDDVMLFREAFKEEIRDGELTVFTHGLQISSHLTEIEKLPDLIFLDINMPLMNGKDCVKAIRKDKKFDAVPVIMYSTSNREEDINETFQSGANMYLRKPASFAELQMMLREVVSLHNAKLLFKTSHSSYVMNSMMM